MPLNTKYLFLAGVLASSALISAQIRRAIEFRNTGTDAAWSAQGPIVFERNGAILLAGADPSKDRVLVASGGSPAWHPSGGLFAFAAPGHIGFSDFAKQQLEGSFPAEAARDLRFSRNGGSLAWTSNSGAVYIRTGALVSAFKLPQGLKLIALDDFSLTGRELFVTAHSSPSNDPRQSEIYACGIAAAGCRALTMNPTQRQDVARLSPSGRTLLFASSETAWVPDAPIDYESDLWVQPVDEPAKARRMTWFNEPANPRYIAATARVTGACWNASGTAAMITVTEGARQDRSRLVKIEFPEAE